MFDNWPDSAVRSLVIAVALAVSACAPAAKTHVEETVEESAAETAVVSAAESTAVVEAREIAFAKTMADRDLDAFLSFVSSEAVFFDGQAALRGHDAIAEAWGPFFEGAAAPFAWEPDLVEVLDSGLLALSSGPVRMPSGEEVARFNTIWRKDADGEWRVVFDKGS